jgi:predicted lipoprotein
MQRRELLKHAAAACLLGGSGLCASCSKPATRAAVLRELATGVGRGDTEAIAKKTAELTRAIADLSASPSDASLEAARTAWRGCLLAWKRAFAFRNGPIVDSNALLRATFWPPRLKEIDALLADASRPVDEKAIEELGVDVKGLYAVEYLLFGSGAPGEDLAGRFQGVDATRRKKLLAAFAANVAFYASTAASAMKDGKDFAERLASEATQSVNKIVNQMILTVEQVATERYAHVLGLAASQSLRASEVEGWPSRTSHRVAAVLLEGTEAIYAGTSELGLSALVRPVAPVVDGRVRAAFSEAREKARALDAPLEQIARDRPRALQAAAKAAKALEIVLKTELPNALGVSITFTGGDGD